MRWLALASSCPIYPNKIGQPARVPLQRRISPVVFQVKGTDGAQTPIKFINKGFPSRNLKLLNVGIWDGVNIFHDAPEAGAMSGDERRSPFHEQRLDALMPIRKQARNCIL